MHERRPIEYGCKNIVQEFVKLVQSNEWQKRKERKQWLGVYECWSIFWCVQYINWNVQSWLSHQHYAAISASHFDKAYDVLIFDILNDSFHIWLKRLANTGLNCKHHTCDVNFDTSVRKVLKTLPNFQKISFHCMPWK